VSDCFFRFTAGPHTKSIFIQPINIAMRYREFKYIAEAVKKTCNRGHALEFHLAVALHERLKQVQYLTRAQLVSAILQYKTPTITDTKNVYEDTFILKGTITKDVIDCTTPESLQPGGLFDPNIKGALSFANRELQKQIEFIHNNERKDKVVATAIGTAGGKVDVQITANGKPLDDLKLSLKFKSGEFGQTKISTRPRSGQLQDLQKTFVNQFTKMFTDLGFPKTFETQGIPIIEQMIQDKKYTTAWTNWYNNYKNNPGRFDLKKQTGPSGSEMVVEVNKAAKVYMEKLYSTMADVMNNTFQGKNGELKEKEILGNFLNNELTGGDDLSVLSFDEKSYTKMPASEIQRLQELIKTIEVRVTDEKAKSKSGVSGVDPYFRFYDATNDELIFAIRNTMDGEHIVKNVYQQGPALNKYKKKISY
tara:strand:+ start:19 stop:1281 length:1263 start_codon:yes stop_codon:yes gene_type:complete